jgi:hypothetical protein
MFFRSKRKMATEAAVAALRPLIALAQRVGGMSTEMWRDPYLLGYLGFVASFFAKSETQGKAKSEDMGFALQEAFTTVSNMSGSAIVRAYIELAELGDPDFERGADEAAAIVFYTTGILKNEAANPLVLEAQRLAEALSKEMLGGDMRSAISAAMTQRTFVSRVKILHGGDDAHTHR